MNMCECIHTHGSRHRCKYRLNMYRHMYIYKCVCVRAYLLPTRQHTCVCIFNLCNSAPSVSPTYAYSQCVCLSIASVSRTYEREKENGVKTKSAWGIFIYTNTRTRMRPNTHFLPHTHTHNHTKMNIYTPDWFSSGAKDDSEKWTFLWKAPHLVHQRSGFLEDNQGSSKLPSADYVMYVS